MFAKYAHWLNFFASAICTALGILDLRDHQWWGAVLSFVLVVPNLQVFLKNQRERSKQNG